MRKPKLLGRSAPWLAALLLLAACGTSTAPSTGAGRASGAAAASGGATAVSAAGLVPWNANTATKTQAAAKADTANAQPGGTLVVVSDQKPENLDPTLHASRYAAMINLNTDDPFIWQPVPNQYVPGLAASWTISPDYKTYTLNLRQDVTFQDGTPLNAQAVIDTWNRMREPAERSLQVGTWATLDHYAATGPYTVQVVWKVPNPGFLQTLTGTGVSPQSPTAIQKEGDSKYILNPVSTGPFMVQGWPDENTLVLVKNPNYKWGPAFMGNTGPAYLDKVIYKFVSDPSTIGAALQSGEASAIEDAPRELNAFYLKNASKYTVEAFMTSGLPQFWSFNLTTWPSNVLAVRQAVNYAMNKQQLANEVFFGTVQPATGPLTTSNWAYWPGDASYYPYDPAKAVQLLQQAGFTKNPQTGYFEQNGKELTLDLVTANDANDTGWAEGAQAMLKKVGINLKIDALAYDATVVRYSANQYNMGRLGLSGTDPDVLYDAFDSSQITGGSQFNRNRLDSPQMDQLLTQGQQLADPQQRIPVYQQIQKIIMDNAYGVWNWQDDYYWVTQACVHGWAWDTSGSYMLHDVWLSGSCRSITGS
jgi:peptide/nickel transport system substrate-binding protein